MITTESFRHIVLEQPKNSVRYPAAVQIAPLDIAIADANGFPSSARSSRGNRRDCHFQQPGGPAAFRDAFRGHAPALLNGSDKAMAGSRADQELSGSTHEYGPV